MFWNNVVNNLNIQKQSLKKDRKISVLEELMESYNNKITSCAGKTCDDSSDDLKSPAK